MHCWSVHRILCKFKIFQYQTYSDHNTAKVPNMSSDVVRWWKRNRYNTAKFILSDCIDRHSTSVQCKRSTKANSSTTVNRSVSNRGDNAYNYRARSNFSKLILCLLLVISLNVMIVFGDRNVTSTKLFDHLEPMIGTNGNIARHYTSTWAVHIPDGDEIAERVAATHGFTNLGKVSNTTMF